MNNATEKRSRVKVWDIGTRLFHWALAILFCVSAFSAFQDKFGIYADMHLWSGFSILVLVSWRIIWGFVGSEPSRFSHFIKSPKALLAYLHGKGTEGVGHNPPSHNSIGHSPIGGYSVLLMLLMLLAQAALGLFASDGMFFGGPLEAGGEYSSLVNNTHQMLGYGLFCVVGFHVLIVFGYWAVRRVNLILPMITGWVVHSSEAPKIARPLLALLLVLAVAVTLYTLIF